MKAARNLANCLIISLYNDEMSAWIHTDAYELKHNDTGLIVNAKTGNIFDGFHPVWMPIIQKIRLRRAARYRTIQIAHDNFYKCSEKVI
jgi:hypothetical protein